MSPVNGVRSSAFLAAVCITAFAGASNARRSFADEPKQRIELRSGDKVEGKILCVTSRHVLVDAPGGARFVERSSVLVAKDTDGSTIDLASRETQETRDAVGLFVNILQNPRIVRGEQAIDPTALSSEGGITKSLLRSKDELRTGPWGSVKVLLANGTILTASRDAVIQFGEGGPVVSRGTARFKEGDVSVAFPEGRVTGKGVDVAFDHTRGRTQITCYQGTCEVEGDGWKLELFKNHTIDVSNGQGDQAPYVAANAANSFPVDLKVGTKRMQIEPGKTVCLVVIRSEREGAATTPEEPRPRPVEEPTRRETTQSTTPTPTGGVARVTNAEGVFWQIRDNDHQWTISPDAASSAVLKAGDEVMTEEKRVSIALDSPQAAIDLNIKTAFVLPAEDVLGAGTCKLKSGQITARVTSSLAVTVPVGEVSIHEGEAIVTASSASAKIRAREGRSIFKLGRDVTADVVPGIDLSGSIADGKATLEASGKGTSFVKVAGVLDLRLPALKTLECSRSDDGTVTVALWNNARVQLDGSLEATIEERDGSLVATSRSGTARTLEPGSVTKLTRASFESSEKPLANVPREPEPQQPTTQLPPQQVPQVQRVARDEKTLSNGAVLTLVNWGAVKEKAATNGAVEVEGPGGSPLILGPGARLTLKRTKAGDAVVSTDDHRSITWAEGKETSLFTLKLDKEGALSVDLPDDRHFTVEKGASFEVELRADGLVHAELVHQTVFVEKGEHLTVTRSGYTSKTTDMAKVGGK